MRNPEVATQGKSVPNPAAGAVPGPKDKNLETSEGRSGSSQGSCLVCSSENVWTFVEIREVPIHSNVLALSASEALRVSKGDLEMKCCRECGHVYNAAFNFEKTEYSSDYENSLFFSETFRTYAASLADGLIERFDLHKKRVAEIGCGSGDFLKLLCEKGENDGIGFDPSALAGRSIDQHPRITFVRDYYSAKHAHLGADFFCCRHVLEHAESPSEFLKRIKEGLPSGKKAGLFFEVPDVMFILKEHSSWDFIYEHCSYFSMSSLQRLFSSCGLEVGGIWRSFYDQFLCLSAEPAGGGMIRKEGASELDKKDVLLNAEIFSQVFQEQVQVWEERLGRLEKSKARVVLWGAGSKGVTFLNILKGKDKNNRRVEYVVDINGQKQGKYIPGTGQRIVSPDFLKEYRPDVVILMNPAYEVEVKKTIAEMKLTPKIIPVNQPSNGGDVTS